MRVPVIDRPSTAVAAAPSYRPQLRAADSSIEEGLATLGQSASNLAGAAQKSYELEKQREQKARLEAEAVAKGQANAEYHKQAQRLLMGDSSTEGRIDDAFDGTDTSKGGFLRVKGLEASAQSGDVLKRLGESRKEIAATLSSQRARQEFLADSAETALAYAKQVEGHVGKEFETARTATAKALDDTVINLAGAGVPDFDAYLVARRQADEAYRTTAPSKEAADAAIADLHSRSALAFATSLVAQGRAREAASFVRENRAEFGARFANAANLVDRAGAGAEKDRLIAEAGRLVGSTAESLAQEGDGYVSEEQLRAAVKLDETDPGVRAEVEMMLERRVRQEAGRLKEDISKQRDETNRADLQGRPIPGATMDFLTKYDPDFLLARQARRRAEARAWKASQSGDARERAVAKERQKSVDLQFRYRLEHALTDDPTAKPDDVIAEFIAERAKEGDDVMVSATEQERAGATAAKRVKESGTTIEASRTKFANDFGAVLRMKMKPSGKGAKVDDELLQQRKGNAASEYSNWVEANGGKPLDATQAAELKARLLKDAVIDPGTTFGPFTFGEKKGLAVDQVQKRPPVPTSAQLPGGFITIRRKSDGRTRSVSAAAAKRFLSDDNFEQVP